MWKKQLKYVAWKIMESHGWNLGPNEKAKTFSYIIPRVEQLSIRELNLPDGFLVLLRGVLIGFPSNTCTCFSSFGSNGAT